MKIFTSLLLLCLSIGAFAAQPMINSVDFNLKTVSCSAKFLSNPAKNVVNSSSVVIEWPRFEASCDDGSTSDLLISSDNSGGAQAICKKSGYHGGVVTTIRSDSTTNNTYNISLDVNNQFKFALTPNSWASAAGSISCEK